MDERAIDLLKGDTVIGPLIDTYGPLELQVADDPFERLVQSILRQQVSMEAADAIAERFFGAIDVSPPALAAANPEDLTEYGLSRQKATYVREVARAFHDNRYTKRYFVGLDDETVIDELTAIRGVGPWTAKMFLMFALGRADIFPVEDLGIRRAMTLHVDAELTRGEMAEYAERWRPVRSYASLYLWRSID